MNILDNSIILLSADGKITGGDQSTVWSAESGTEASVTTGTSTAQPQGDPAADTADPQGAFFTNILIWGVMLAAMYFFLFRPQRKQAKEMKTLQETLKTGENVITSSGLYGKIVGVGQDSFLVEFGENKGVRIWIRKSDIIGIKTPVTTPPPVDSIEDKKSK